MERSSKVAGDEVRLRLLASLLRYLVIYNLHTPLMTDVDDFNSGRHGLGHRTEAGGCVRQQKRQEQSCKPKKASSSKCNSRVKESPKQLHTCCKAISVSTIFRWWSRMTADQRETTAATETKNASQRRTVSERASAQAVAQATSALVGEQCVHERVCTWTHTHTHTHAHVGIRGMIMFAACGARQVTAAQQP